MKKRPPIYTRYYDLLGWILEHTAKFPKNTRFAFDDRPLVFLPGNLSYGDASKVRTVLVEVSKLLEAYSPACSAMLPRRAALRAGRRF